MDIEGVNKWDMGLARFVCSHELFVLRSNQLDSTCKFPGFVALLGTT